MKIAVIAHDGTKDRLRGFIQSNSDVISNHTIVCTKSTSKIVKEFNLDVSAVESGPLGGDAQIAAQIVSNEIEAVLFFERSIGEASSRTRHKYVVEIVRCVPSSTSNQF